MAQTPITELDFFQIKEQLKAYLRGQTRFKDYDFDGSNMSVLLDILAYNTYQNNFYTNMAVSEMFLDSAQLESSIMSHAKELNYLPRSATSSRAEVNLRITAPSLNNISTLTIPTNQKFYTTHNGDVYNFYTDRAYVATLRSGSAGVYQIDCMPVFEGEMVTETFYLSEAVSTLSLSNLNVDISSVRVFLNGGTEEFLFRSSIFGVQPTDKVFYIEPTLTGNYGITFGRNAFGREPSFNEDIRVTYRVCSGSSPNGAFKFSTNFTYPAAVTTFSSAMGGGDKESLSSVKYFAPKSIQNQERAVTARDYEALLRKEFGSSTIKSVSVYGGDEMNPPRYGKVAVSINPYDGTTISDSFKTSVLSFLSDKTPLPIQPVFVDPEFMYAKVDLTVYYSRKVTGKSAIELESLIREAIQSYSSTYLSEFGATLQISRLSKIVDEVDIGILSNTMQANPIIDYSPPTILFQNPQFRFGSPLVVPYAFDANEDINNYNPAIKSTPYIYNGIDVFFQDDGKGNIITLSSNLQSVQVLNPIVGTVDYSTGLLNLVNFSTDGYTGSAIKIHANTIDRNITSPKNRVFSIRNVDVSISMIESQ
jgi:hypothetical protein